MSRAKRLEKSMAERLRASLPWSQLTVRVTDAVFAGKPDAEFIAALTVML
jgi:hypothetical protein